MWQNWVNGILGLWIILMGFLGLSASLSRILLIISGLVIAILSFWAASSKGFEGEQGDNSGPGESSSNESF